MIEYKLNIGDLRVTKGENVTYACLGLGSCIGLFLQDRILGLSGGAHIQLPNEIKSSDGKFYSVKSAIAELLNQFRISGSSLKNLRAKITGGANVITTSCETGVQNIERVVQELVENKVYIAAMDVGGKKSRTARFNSETGMLTVRNPETNEIKFF
ncbi:MAG: chemotaxis protein CheD [Cyclobacteriaceae bacterium]